MLPVLVGAVLMLVPSTASAQNAEIAGVVRDASGAVLPGVTVEAASPALIERIRVVNTDSQGQYRIIALNPGTYKVTYTLPGFSTTVRDGIVLTAQFTASLDVAMAVGSLEETVTVSGATPLVDIQATTQRRALTSELLNELPTGRSFQNMAILVPGVQMPLLYQDVGGSDGNRWQTLRIHGSRDDQMPLLLNGMPFNNMNNSGGGYNHTFAINTGTVQEMTVTTSGSTAEARTSGVVSNTVAKEGGNQFNSYFYTDFTNSSLQSDNLSADLISRGVSSVPRVKRIVELNPTIGGPIVKDRLWFYGGYRYLTTQKYLANAFLNKTPNAPQYCARASGCTYLGRLVPDSRDLTQQDFSGDSFHHSYTANLTWQISQKNKVNLYYHLGDRHLDGDSGINASPEAANYLYSKPDYISQAQWTSPLTSRVLLEGGFSFVNEQWWSIQRERPAGVVLGYGSNASIPKLEASIPAAYGANLQNTQAYNHQWNMRFAVNYVTGSHAFKVGMTDLWGTRNFTYNTNQAQRWIFLNGAPIQITQYARPLVDLQKLKSALGVFAQDRWSIGNVTMNLGLRFDFHNAYVPAQSIAAIPFVGAQSYDALTNTPSWKDLSPRLGAAWDIRGNGKTVARFNYGHYVASESVATATANNPVNTRINNATRRWTDDNGNFFPDCNLANNLANGECGALAVPLGNPNIVTRWDPAVLNGWNVRPNDDEILVGLQQQVTDRLMVDAQWTYHWFGNFFATQSRATPPEAYDTYCVTAPVDSRLPGGGGNQVCGLADLKPSFVGRTPDNFVTSTSTFGNVEDVWSGFDLNATSRFARGGVASGGVSLGRHRSDFCDVIGNVQIGSNTDTTAGKVFLDNVVGNNINLTVPNAAGYPSSLYCSVKPPYQPDWKALVSYPLPYGLNASATWQNRPGPQKLATLPVSAATTTTLGRPLALGTASAPLMAPGTEFADRLNQLDVRLGRTFKVGNRGRVQGTFSVYNLLNANSTLVWNTTYGPAWLTPSLILQGRLVKFGAQFDF
jgi:hypothetical protein